MEEKEVLAMYDVRGIQKYIYRTLKLKDAMGASALIEDIITDALRYACNRLDIKNCELNWYDDNGVLRYKKSNNKDITVLYIGGGNAFVIFKCRTLCVEINKHMSKYIIEQTYSLQLAVAIVDKTENYQNDYKSIYREMNRIKSDMTVSKPLSALPIMKTELKTGFPAINILSYKEKIDKKRIETNVSKETYLKILKKNKENEEDDIDKILDNYAKRGDDSRIAVVHIDGNNMGLRIRKLIENKTDYEDAVNEMRKISYNIKHSYLDTFEDMKKKFEKENDDKIKRFVRKIIVAGDDITYVCNAYIALDTVKYFCNKISKLTMNRDKNDVVITQKDINEYGFTVCAGIAFIRSHFPFNVGYEVAEACCDSAKDMAKARKNKAYFKIKDGVCTDIEVKEYEKHLKENAEGERVLSDGYFEKVGNFVDFQICKNVQCMDLEQTREKEYITSNGENLMLRPYYIEMSESVENNSDKLDVINGNKENVFSKLKRNINYFSNEGIKNIKVHDAETLDDKEKNMPRSMAKDIRNKYSLGRQQIHMLASFLDSRSWKLPDDNKCSENMYVKPDECNSKDDGALGLSQDMNIAKWYDALEIMDYCYNTLEDSDEEGGEDNGE